MAYPKPSPAFDRPSIVLDHISLTAMLQSYPSGRPLRPSCVYADVDWETYRDLVLNSTMTELVYILNILIAHQNQHLNQPMTNFDSYMSSGRRIILAQQTILQMLATTVTSP